MRIRTASTVAMTLLVGTVGLTACKSGSDTASGTSSASSAASSAPSGASSSGSSAAGGGGSNQATSGTGKGGSAATSTSAPGGHCTAADVSIAIQPTFHNASNGGPATAMVRVHNTSSHTCTLKGYPGLKVTDSAGAESVTANRQGGQEAWVKLAPGGEADAALSYDNVNFQGSGAKACKVTATSADVILPDDTRTVKAQVQPGGVDKGKLILCAAPSVEPFALGGR